MGEVVTFPTSLDGELDYNFVADLARYADGTLSEAAIRAKYRLDDTVWASLGDNDKLVRAIEDEKIRRIRSGDTKREKAQLLVTKAPDVLSDILLDAGANARHRIDASKVLNDFASSGPQSAPASDRYIITINLSADGVLHTEHFDKSIEINADDVDPNDIGTAPIVAAIATKKTPEGGDGNAL
jgi:hypothetical protein